MPTLERSLGRICTRHSLKQPAAMKVGHDNPEISVQAENLDKYIEKLTVPSKSPKSEEHVPLSKHSLFSQAVGDCQAKLKGAYKGCVCKMQPEPNCAAKRVRRGNRQETSAARATKHLQFQGWPSSKAPIGSVLASKV